MCGVWSITYSSSSRVLMLLDGHASLCVSGSEAADCRDCLHVYFADCAWLLCNLCKTHRTTAAAAVLLLLPTHPLAQLLPQPGNLLPAPPADLVVRKGTDYLTGLNEFKTIAIMSQHSRLQQFTCCASLIGFATCLTSATAPHRPS